MKYLDVLDVQTCRAIKLVKQLPTMAEVAKAAARQLPNFRLGQKQVFL